MQRRAKIFNLVLAKMRNSRSMKAMRSIAKKKIVIMLTGKLNSNYSALESSDSLLHI